jgi:signal recognition particle subunit SRP54
MLENITKRFKDVFTNLGKKPAITEKDLEEVLREIRLVLLEADVSLELTKVLVAKLKEDLLGKEIYRSVSPKQVILKSLYDSLFDILDSKPEETELATNPITYQMLVGLQGVGKTTTAGKIASYLKNTLKKKVLLVSLDFNRPAAYEQLKSLATQVGVDFFEYQNKDFKEVLPNVKSHAAKNFYDVVLLDTAGRNNLDQDLMVEMEMIYKTMTPKEVLLVLDSMIGQSSLQVAKAFKQAVPLSGIIISKADADSRGGAIISCKYITQVPIKFMGVGEKLNNLEKFSAKRMVDRILDQGDIISLVERFEEVEEEEMHKMQENLEKGIFTMDDLKKQFLQMKKMGGFSSMLSMIPGLGGVGNIKDKLAGAGLNENTMKKHIAIIDSMTKLERRKPDILNFSRKKRIAKGSGTTLQDINILLKQYEQMSKMMKTFKGGGLSNMQSMLQGMGAGGKKPSMAEIKKLMDKIK